MFGFHFRGIETGERFIWQEKEGETSFRVLRFWIVGSLPPGVESDEKRLHAGGSLQKHDNTCGVASDSIDLLNIVFNLIFFFFFTSG